MNCHIPFFFFKNGNLLDFTTMKKKILLVKTKQKPTKRTEKSGYEDPRPCHGQMPEHRRKVGSPTPM